MAKEIQVITKGIQGPSGPPGTFSPDYIWQAAVIDKDLSSPPGSPADGDRYIVAAGANGDWSLHSDDIAIYDELGATWSFITPVEGMKLWVQDEDEYYLFLASVWQKDDAIVTHNLTTGLQGGTTNQYFHLTQVEHTDTIAHIGNVTKHREINDSALGTTDLWSADKISSEITKVARKWSIILS